MDYEIHRRIKLSDGLLNKGIVCTAQNQVLHRVGLNKAVQIVVGNGLDHLSLPKSVFDQRNKNRACFGAGVDPAGLQLTLINAAFDGGVGRDYPHILQPIFGNVLHGRLDDTDDGGWTEISRGGYPYTRR